MNVLIYDTRLNGKAPKGDFLVLEVNEYSKLSELVTKINIIANKLGKIECLQIMAHGIEQDENGEFGILLGKDELTGGTVYQLNPLYGKIGKIVLLMCVPREIKDKGNLLGHQIASTTGAWVKTSTYKQEGVAWNQEKSRDSNNFGNWKSDCWWFSPKGMKYKADYRHALKN